MVGISWAVLFLFDHHRTRKWLITMVIVSPCKSPKDRVVGPLPSGQKSPTNGGY